MTDKPRVILVGDGTNRYTIAAMLTKAREAGHDVEILTMAEAQERGLPDAEPELPEPPDVGELIEQMAPKPEPAVREIRANPHLTSLMMLAAAAGGGMPRLPGGRIQPVKRCPTCGSEGRGRYCTENGHHKRRVAREDER